jgi:hypothetical protein
MIDHEVYSCIDGDYQFASGPSQNYCPCDADEAATIGELCDGCPEKWGAAIRKADLSRLYPMELVDSARDAWCMSFVLKDGRIVESALRAELSQGDSETASSLHRIEEMARSSPD